MTARAVTVKRRSGEVIGEGDRILAVCEQHRANLGGAYLRGAYLRDANLRGAYLGGADLRYAYLRGAYLRDANLRCITVSWQSYDLIAEILRRAAGNDESRLMLAGYVLMRRDWCWDRWAEWKHPERAWAIAELAKWVKDGDGAPVWIKGGGR